MATRSRPPSRARSPVDQGQLEPFLPPASPELGKVSLERVICLLWGLQSQVDRIKRTLLEQAKVSQEVWTNVKNILQAVDTVKDGLAQLQHTRGPHTPEEQKPPAVKETPRAAPKAKPIGKAQPFLGAPAPIISTGAPRRDPLSLFNPYPTSSFPSGPAPAAPQGPPPAPVITSAQPPAPSTVKVDHPDAFKGKIGSEAKQWLTRMLAWVRLNQRQFPSDLEVLSFLLMNMTEAAGAWAHPHLDQLGSHRALIQTVDEFKVEFLAAFGNPDATRAAERKITSLTQTGTCAEYITKFRTLQMELNWNNAALRGQFARGLHWEVRKQIATRERQPRTLRELQDAALIIDNALCKEQASHPQQGNKSGKTSSTPNRGASTGQQATKTGPLSSNPNYVSEEEHNRCRAEGLCVKCGKPGHKFAECRTGWKATPKEEKGKAKETAKVGKDLEYQLGKE
ncbi:Retrotransposon gag protein, partial [Rhizoctonia solani]